ncbi:hypothetical protein ACHAXR_003618 [Thalassiosira sp. AJA248-18]
MIDFAGSGVVHVTGGFTALIASKILGPRKHHFDEAKGVGMPRRVEGNSSSLQALGCLILCGLVGVSTATLANIASLSAVTTTLGASAGAVTFRIDDAVEAIPVHLGPGIWGVVSVGLFASPRRLEEVYGHSNHHSLTHGSSDATLLGTNLVGLLFIMSWVLVTMLPFFFVLSYLGWFRTDSLEEIIGLDPHTHQAPDSITKQHLAVLKKQIDAREGRVNEDEV